MDQYIKISDKMPPENIVVKTKIDDDKGIRNIQNLKRIGRLYFHPDGLTYVNYTPTHWAKQ